MIKKIHVEPIRKKDIYLGGSLLTKREVSLPLRMW
mgnify:CR=1 FL=1